MNILDWKKLEKFIKERKPVSVDAGILNDWFWTAATVYENGEWKDKGNAYVASSWGTPGFKAKMGNGEVIEVVAMTEETEEQAKEREAKSKKAREDLKTLAAGLAESKTPPPYVPPEYRNCKYSEMPEPYKSEIDAWIGITTARYEARASAAKKGMLIALSIAGLIAIVAAIVLV